LHYRFLHQGLIKAANSSGGIGAEGANRASLQYFPIREVLHLIISYNYVFVDVEELALDALNLYL